MLNPTVILEDEDGYCSRSISIGSDTSVIDIQQAIDHFLHKAPSRSWSVSDYEDCCEFVRELSTAEELHLYGKMLCEYEDAWSAYLEWYEDQDEAMELDELAIKFKASYIEEVEDIDYCKENFLREKYPNIPQFVLDAINYDDIELSDIGDERHIIYSDNSGCYYMFKS